MSTPNLSSLFQTLDCEQMETLNGGRQSCQWTYVPQVIFDPFRRRFVTRLVLKRQCYWV